MFDGETIYYVSEDAEDLLDVVLDMARFIHEDLGGSWTEYQNTVDDAIDAESHDWIFEELSDHLHRVLLPHGYSFGTLADDPDTYVAIPNQQF